MAQLVEHHLAKVRVAGSNPVVRSISGLLNGHFLMAASLSQSSLHILDHYLNVLPTFTIREGHRIKVYLSQDLKLPAYDRHPVVQ